MEGPMGQITHKAMLFAVLGATIGFFAAPALADSIDYGDFAGTTVNFEDVTESSGTDSVPLYGQPTVTGDTLRFSPTEAFFAEAGSYGDTTDGKLELHLQAADGYQISAIRVTEGGDYSVIGPGTAVAAGSIGANDVMVPLDGLVLVLGDVIDSDVWSSGGELVLADPTEMVDIVIDNTLQAATGEAGAAFIIKKIFILEVVTVPEPSSLLLLASGTAALAVRRRYAKH